MDFLFQSTGTYSWPRDRIIRGYEEGYCRVESKTMGTCIKEMNNYQTTGQAKFGLLVSEEDR